jgi:multisubunit Na+/H+ antiporter MnhB subunit
MALQFAVTGEHALFGHFGGMAIASVYVVLMGAFAIVRRRDWRFAAYSAGLVAVVTGAGSILFTVESSVGPLWGTLSVRFGVVFVAAVESVRRTEIAEPTAMGPRQQS